MKSVAGILLFFASLGATYADTKVVLLDSQLFADDAKDFLVTSTIPGDFRTPEGIVAALLILGNQAANSKLTAPFFPKSISSTSGGENALPLAEYYRGARLERDRIILSFSGEAMRYLNNTVSIQQVVKGSIEGTLRLHFPSVTGIDYEIDGEIVSDWDA